MRLIYDIQDVTAHRRPDAARRWTAIVPAAGAGARLGTNTPKVLYPVLGRSLLEWLVDTLKPLCWNIVLVVSPQGWPLVQPELERLMGPRGQAVIQEQPTGMADAVALAMPQVKTEFSLVIWGDQVATHPRTLSAAMTILETSAGIHAVIPTILRDDPYIDLVRDAAGRVVSVYEARESEERRPKGENDCGSFLFRSARLAQVLKETRGNPAYVGAKTKENNFLPLLPLFHDEQGVLAAMRIHDAEETRGINTPADAEAVARMLKTRR
jgi:bifunctional UDP-N-acetylglucosamine pyrophosphorylase/glucosamine-1-phosphate N-acetyltransferase